MAVGAGAVSGVSLSGARHGGYFVGYGIALVIKYREDNKIKRKTGRRGG